jgi:putative hydrolase of the HAD superfamily
MEAGKQMKKLKAIFLDIDNTLFATTEFATLARSNGLKAMIDHGLKGDLSDLEAQLNEIVSEFGSNDSGHYYKLLKRVPKEALNRHNPAILEAAGIVGYGQTKFRHYSPHEDVIEVLKILSQTDLLLGVLSNGRTLKQAEKLVRLGILPYINPEAIFISEQTGIAKPNPRIFSMILDKFNFKAEEVMMVGDKTEMDIEPARKLGIVAVQNCRNIAPSRKNEADYHINNFWDLLDVLKKDFGI